jgi:hypothetical protein
MDKEITLREHCTRVGSIGGKKKSAKKTESCRANARLPRRKLKDSDHLQGNKNK